MWAYASVLQLEAAPLIYVMIKCFAIWDLDDNRCWVVNEEKRFKFTFLVKTSANALGIKNMAMLLSHFCFCGTSGYLFPFSSYEIHSFSHKDKTFDSLSPCLQITILIWLLRVHWFAPMPARKLSSPTLLETRHRNVLVAMETVQKVGSLCFCGLVCGLIALRDHTLNWHFISFTHTPALNHTTMWHLLKSLSCCSDK